MAHAEQPTVQEVSEELNRLLDYGLGGMQQAAERALKVWAPAEDPTTTGPSAPTAACWPWALATRATDCGT